MVLDGGDHSHLEPAGEIRQCPVAGATGGRAVGMYLSFRRDSGGPLAGADPSGQADRWCRPPGTCRVRSAASKRTPAILSWPLSRASCRRGGGGPPDRCGPFGQAGSAAFLRVGEMRSVVSGVALEARALVAAFSQRDGGGPPGRCRPFRAGRPVVAILGGGRWWSVVSGRSRWTHGIGRGPCRGFLPSGVGTARLAGAHRFGPAGRRWRSPGSLR
jgi:hypothetical protein